MSQNQNVPNSCFSSASSPCSLVFVRQFSSFLRSFILNEILYNRTNARVVILYYFFLCVLGFLKLSSSSILSLYVYEKTNKKNNMFYSTGSKTDVHIDTQCDLAVVCLISLSLWKRCALCLVSLGVFVVSTVSYYLCVHMCMILFVCYTLTRFTCSLLSVIIFSSSYSDLVHFIHFHLCAPFYFLCYYIYTI